ncbi:MAG: hypothetical protein KF814_16535 [Nitrospiraceae bacterium]|nr:hypothetical protein [Nitrospiraceae bacterium]
MTTILLINADETLRRMVGLAAPAKDLAIRHAGSLAVAQIQAASQPPDLVIARSVIRDDQGPEELAELRRTFPDVKIAIVAVLHEPALESEKFKTVAQALRLDYCLIEPVAPASLQLTLQSALASRHPQSVATGHRSNA